VFVTENVLLNSTPGVSAVVRFSSSSADGNLGRNFTTFEDVDGNSFVLAGWDDMTRQIESPPPRDGQKAESERAPPKNCNCETCAGQALPQTAPPLRTLNMRVSVFKPARVGAITTIS